MPHNITGSNVFTDPVPTYSDGDPIAAASEDPTIQALANRDVNLNTRLTAAAASIVTNTSAIAAINAAAVGGFVKAWSVIAVAGASFSLVHSLNVDTVAYVTSGGFYFDFHFPSPFFSVDYCCPVMGVSDGTVEMRFGMVPFSSGAVGAQADHLHVFTYDGAGANFNLSTSGLNMRFFLHVDGVA